MKDIIPRFLLEKFKLKRTKTNIFPSEIKQFMIEYSKFYDWNLEDNVLNIYKLMASGISELPICEYSGCSKKVYIKSKQDICHIQRGCCIAHQTKITNLEKYGVENPFQNEEIKQKIIKTNLKNYGVENPMLSETVKQNMKHNCKEKYGVESTFQLETTKSKIKDTMIEKYGVKNPTQSNIIRKKKSEKLYEKFGVNHTTQLESTKNKIKETNLKKFGIEHSGLSNNGFKRKQYKWSTGEISWVQGYEPIVLKELDDAGYTFEEILTEPSKMPKINYEYDGKIHRYYPDIYIPKENMIIEVKSDYTFNFDLERNNAKFDATKKLGFIFKLELR